MLAKTKVEIREGSHFDHVKDISWNAAVILFREWIQTNVAPKTRESYENSLKIMAPYFDKLTLNQITAELVEDFKRDRLKKGLSPRTEKNGVSNSTLNRDLATLKRLFSLCVEWGKIEVNRIAKVKKMKENDARTRFLTEPEIHTLLSNCRQEWLRMAVQIALKTGLRKDAVLSLQWSEIDFKGRLIEKKGKGGKTVKIPMTGSLLHFLSEYRAGQKVMSRYVIPSPSDPNKPIHVTVHEPFDKAVADSKIENFRFHDLRHCFATNFLRRTGDMNTLRKILGHSSAQMTQRYAHVLDETMREQMDKFDSHG
jgi:integrase